MRQKIAVFDIDGTLFRWQLDHAVMFELENMGAIHGFRQALQDSYTDWKNRKHPDSFKEYAVVFDEVTAHYLSTLSLTTFNKAVQRVIHGSSGEVYRYTRQLIKKLKSQGYAVAAISGSLHEIVEPFARTHGFDIWQGQTLGIKGDRFIDTYGSFSHGQKAIYLHEFVEKYGCTIEGSIGVGDTLSDVSMLEIVERPIVFNPNQQLMDHAMQKNWEIVIERKNVIYQLSARDGRYELEQSQL